MPGGVGASDGAKKADRKQEAALAKLQAAASAAEAGDCRKTAKLAGEVIDKDASVLPPNLRAAGYTMAASCEVALGDQANAYRHAVSGTALIESPDELWHLRLSFELEGRRYGDAVTTVEVMMQGRGAALNSVPEQWFYQMDNALKADGPKPLRRRLLAVLASGSYIPDTPAASVDPFRIRYARLLDEAGDAAAAKHTIEQIEDPSTLLDASLDPRLRKFVPADLDLRRQVELKLAELRTVMQLRSEFLGPLIYAATYLRVLGRPAEALALLDSVKSKTADPKAFIDRDKQLPWWWDARARAYTMLGRYDDEVAAYRSGAGVNENGGVNVSQTVNLAQTQVEIGRPADALDTLKVFDDAAPNASPFGIMQIRFTRACARMLLGKLAEADQDVQFVRDHEKDAPQTVTETLLCIGDLDGAAASLVRHLDDPEERASALRYVSEFDVPPVTPPPSPIVVNLPKIKARADVKAAIVRAGGARQFNIQQVSF